MFYSDSLRDVLKRGCADGQGFAVRLLALLVLFGLFIAVAGSVEAARKSVTAQAISAEGNSVRTVFYLELSKEVGFTATVLPEPFRVIIDIKDIAFDLPPGAGRKPLGLMQQVRYGVIDPGKSRIVIDTTGPVLIEKSYVEPAKGKKPARIVVELMATTAEVFAVAFAKDHPDAATQVPQQTTASIAPVQLPIIKPTKTLSESHDGLKVIVIDPGHGGIDPGAMSHARVKEKDVVLAFAQALKKVLETDGDYSVQLTRDDDRFVSLGDRVKFARHAAADLFIAIHADTVRGQTARGTTIYTVSDKASDAEAEALAQKENRADVIAGIDLDQQNEDVADILIDLVQRESKNHATLFSRAAHESLKGITTMTGKPLRSAGFFVLKAPDVPSVLIELGYLSSKEDVANLVSDKWRNRMAKGLANAINKHFGVSTAAAAP